MGDWWIGSVILRKSVQTNAWKFKFVGDCPGISDKESGLDRQKEKISSFGVPLFPSVRPI
jgi:hypothetical protein